MTQYEAKQALNNGERVRHRFFTKDEYIHRCPSNGQLLDETGFHLSETMFWFVRSGNEWDEGWEIYNQENE